MRPLRDRFKSKLRARQIVELEVVVMLETLSGCEPLVRRCRMMDVHERSLGRPPRLQQASAMTFDAASHHDALLEKYSVPAADRY